VSVFFEVGAFFEEGAFYEALAPVVPVAIDIGEPGHPIFALPFRALGGSVADLDLLYGILNREDAIEDIQPIFFLTTRAGTMRAYGLEVPRQAILDEVVEASATLMEVDDVSVEGNPAGTNLFGFVGLTTRPMTTVTLNNSDGALSDLDDRELLMGCPAALFWDVGHAILVPELIGTVNGINDEGPLTRITFGMSARRTRAPNVTD
jgi:hypothetical protein